tara:strand:+ start:327 stop:455 length:129 start_codon:yes stop_codon:yes gene_type:complete
LDLGKSVEEVMNFSTFELKGWVDYFTWVNNETKKAQQKRGRR